MNTTLCSKICSQHFDYSKETKVFSQDMSMLTYDGRRQSPIRRIWADSCDEGFVMISETTHAEVVFVAEEHRRGDDVTHWTFKPTPLEIYRNTALVGVSVTIWNT